MAARARPTLTSAPSENGPGQQAPPVCAVQDSEMGVASSAVVGMQDGAVIDEQMGDAKRIAQRDNHHNDNDEDWAEDSDDDLPPTEATGLLRGKGSLRRRKVNSKQAEQGGLGAQADICASMHSPGTGGQTPGTSTSTCSGSPSAWL